jgi:hypothetical protein
LAGADVRVERGASEEKRAFRRQGSELDRRRLARCIAVGNQYAPHGQTVERAFEGGFADRVVNDRHAFGIELANLGLEVFARVHDDVVCAVLLGKLGLFVGAHGGDDLGTDVAQPLQGEQADASGCGVQQHRLRKPHCVHSAHQ